MANKDYTLRKPRNRKKIAPIELEPEELPTSEAAYYLGMSVRMLKHYREGGTKEKGPKFKFDGKRYSYPVDELEKWKAKKGL